MNISWWKLTKIGHEMWINSLYLWLAVCSKKSSAIYLLFRRGSCRWLAVGHMACGRQGQDKILPCCNPFVTLSCSASNSENTNNCWELLGSVSHVHYSPVPRTHLSSQTTGRVNLGFPDTKCGISRSNIQFTKHPLSVQQVNLLLTWYWGSWYRLCMLRAKSVLSSDASHVVLSHSWFDKVGKTGKFQLLNLYVQ